MPQNVDRIINVYVRVVRSGPSIEEKTWEGDQVETIGLGEYRYAER